MSIRLVTKTGEHVEPTPINVFVGWDGSIDSQGYDFTEEQKRSILSHAKKFILNEKALANTLEAHKEFWDSVEC